jgi:hypothetical protein
MLEPRLGTLYSGCAQDRKGAAGRLQAIIIAMFAVHSQI